MYHSVNIVVLMVVILYGMLMEYKIVLKAEGLKVSGSWFLVPGSLFFVLGSLFLVPGFT